MEGSTPIPAQSEWKPRRRVLISREKWAGSCKPCRTKNGKGWWLIRRHGRRKPEAIARCRHPMRRLPVARAMEPDDHRALSGSGGGEARVASLDAENGAPPPFTCRTTSCGFTGWRSNRATVQSRCWSGAPPPNPPQQPRPARVSLEHGRHQSHFWQERAE